MGVATTSKGPPLVYRDDFLVCQLALTGSRLSFTSCRTGRRRQVFTESDHVRNVVSRVQAHRQKRDHSVDMRRPASGRSRRPCGGR